MSPLQAVASLDLASAGRLVGALRTHDDGEDGAGRQQLPQISGYRPRRRLGSGGGGVVYEALAEGTGQRLAIKLLSAPYPYEAPFGGGDRAREGDSARRAWRELDLLAQIRLPAVPRVIDYGLHEGRLYIVTEYVDGVPLDEYCGARPGPSGQVGPPLSLGERVAQLANVADAVQSLHEHGVIHRDLKPANILIDPRGSPVIVDLGIATLVARDVMDTLTLDGAPVGTPAFMAPEQARAERGSISTRSDVYSLGATATLVLTGHTPHDLATEPTPNLAAAVHRIAHEPPRDPRELDPTLPPPLAAILAKATDPNPGRRYASAGALAEDLRRWIRGEPVLASPPSRWGRAACWIGRHPVVSTASACILILLLTTAATALLGRVVYLHPYEMAVEPVTRSRADLVTITGRPLETWNGGEPHSILFAGLLRDEPAIRGETAVVIGWSATADSPERGALAAYDPARPGTPLWVRGVGGADLRQPQPSPDGYPDHFTLRHTLLCDVFPDLPGTEIVAVHTHTPFSPCAIRVYDAAGAVLWEVWHDGHIALIHWLPDPGVIVACGANADAAWEQLGGAGLTGQHWPQVVFAVRPRIGHHAGFIATPHGGGNARAAWYKFLAPQRASAVLVGRSLGRPPPPFDARSAVRWALAAGDRPDAPAITITLDADGNIIDRFQGDLYPSPDRPRVEEVHLLDAPPAAAPGREAYPERPE